jgi:flagellar assembly protein FliH
MSSKARRLGESVILPFDWSAGPQKPVPKASWSSRSGGSLDPPGQPAAPAPAPADTGTQATHLAGLERDAFSKGFAQGERAGAEASGKRGEVVLRRLTETLEELTTLREQMIHQTERQMVQLALAIARRIVQREISLDQDLLVAMARVALDRLGESAHVTVRLNPEDYQATAAARAAEWTGTQVSVIADARVARGGCRVESDFGMMDAGADAQIQEIARALLGDSGERNEAPVAVP